MCVCVCVCVCARACFIMFRSSTALYNVIYFLFFVITWPPGSQSISTVVFVAWRSVFDHTGWYRHIEVIFLLPYRRSSIISCVLGILEVYFHGHFLPGSFKNLCVYVLAGSGDVYTPTLVPAPGKPYDQSFFTTPFVHNLWGWPRGVMIKAMDSGIVVCEFELQSRYYVHFRANTLGKAMNPLILPSMG